MKIKLLLILSLLTPHVYAQNILKMACINNNIKTIETTSKCQIYIEELKAIKEPNCYYSETVSASTKIMNEAKKNNCIVNSSIRNINKQKPSIVFDYTSEADIVGLMEAINEYNDDNEPKAN